MKHSQTSLPVAFFAVAALFMPDAAAASTYPERTISVEPWALPSIPDNLGYPYSPDIDFYGELTYGYMLGDSDTLIEGMNFDIIIPFVEAGGTEKSVTFNIDKSDFDKIDYPPFDDDVGLTIDLVKGFPYGSVNFRNLVEEDAPFSMDVLLGFGFDRRNAVNSREGATLMTMGVSLDCRGYASTSPCEFFPWTEVTTNGDFPVGEGYTEILWTSGTMAVVPVPASLPLTAAGLLMLFGAGWRKPARSGRLL